MACSASSLTSGTKSRASGPSGRSELLSISNGRVSILRVMFSLRLGNELVKQEVGRCAPNHFAHLGSPTPREIGEVFNVPHRAVGGKVAKLNQSEKATLPVRAQLPV